MAEPDLAQKVKSCALIQAFKVALSLRKPLKCTLENDGATQIYTGIIDELTQQSGQLGVRSATFDLSIDMASVDSVWVVNVPTRDGWVVLLEAYAATGELITQLASDRQAGEPERYCWQQLLLGFCGERLRT